MNESGGKKEGVCDYDGSWRESCESEFVSAMSRCLDVVEKRKHPKSLVLTGTGKFLSSGLDLDFVMGGSEGRPCFWKDYGIFFRLLVFDCFRGV